MLQSFAEGAGSPLVMLGGGTFGAEAFAPHARMLGTDFRVLRLQTINIEQAQKQQPLPAGYSVRLESAAVTKALDMIGIAAAVDIVGWSYGGLVALNFALDYPDRVRTLALFEPPAFWVVPPEELRSASDMRAIYELGNEVGAANEPTDDQHVRFLSALGNSGAKPPSPEQPQFQEWMVRRLALRCLSAISSHTDDPDRLKTFRRPVLIMTGSETVPFHHRINAILAAALPMVERVQLEGSHTAPITAREQFVAKLRDFLARHERGRVGLTEDT